MANSRTQRRGGFTTKDRFASIEEDMDRADKKFDLLFKKFDRMTIAGYVLALSIVSATIVFG